MSADERVRREGGLSPAGPVRVGRILEGLLDRSGVRIQLERTSVLDEWAERVGEAIAQVTRARALSEDTLFVEVRSSGWLMELNMMKADILVRINEGRQEARIERIVFVLADGP